MRQLRELWARLTLRQRVLLIAAAGAVVGALLLLEHWNQQRGFEVLFSGMAPEDAGAVTSKLREGNVEYRLEQGGATILVKAARVAELRLELAAAGLPQTGRIGFELFDQANFGASEFTEQVNYHRAIEGELERSVTSLKEVERARVHITLAKESLYLEARQPAKASILVQLRRGSLLSPQNIAAVAQLAASAVPGLQANQVSVLDTNGNLLNRPRAAGLEDSQASEAVLEYRKALERDVQMKVAQTLEPLLGPEHFRVGVSAEIDLTSGEQSEEVFDPNRSVMVSSQTSQDVPALGAAEAGVPGTASNLPRATAAQAGAAVAVTSYGRRTENTTFQTSRVVRHTKLGQGGLKKLSLSILVDHELRYEQGQPVIEVPAPEKLQVIKGLVAAAAGIDTGRGDQLVVEAFPFESTLAAKPLVVDPAPGAPAGPPAGLALPEWLRQMIQGVHPMVVAGVGAGVLLAVAAGGLLLWWRRKKKTGQGSVESSKHLASPAEEAEREIEARLAAQAAEQQRLEAEAILSLKLPAVATKKTDVLIRHISGEVKRDPAAMAQVVRSWLNGEYQR